MPTNIISTLGNVSARLDDAANIITLDGSTALAIVMVAGMGGETAAHQLCVRGIAMEESNKKPQMRANQKAQWREPCASAWRREHLRRRARHGTPARSRIHASYGFITQSEPFG